MAACACLAPFCIHHAPPRLYYSFRHERGFNISEVLPLVQCFACHADQSDNGDILSSLADACPTARAADQAYLP
jgi:hypothetical protein